MIYTLPLKIAGFVVGGFSCLFGLLGLLRGAAGRDAANRFPRARTIGVVLLTIDLLWMFWLLITVEMGEFVTFRTPLLFALPIAYGLTLRFVNEFLAVRALGMLALLAAEPLLDAAFFRYEPMRLLVTVFAYIIVVLGLIWVTMPYMLRDQILWLTRTSARWIALHASAIVYGLAVLAVAFLRF